MNQHSIVTDDRLNTLLNELELLATEASKQGVQDKVRHLLQSFEIDSPDNADEQLADCATEIYRIRRRRERQLGRDLLGEPGWDLMLDLFINTVRSVPVSVTGACIATNVPTTTALRWISVLEERGLLKRYPDPFDRRVVLVRLTDDGLKRMRGILAEMVARGFSAPETEAGKKPKRRR